MRSVLGSEGCCDARAATGFTASSRMNSAFMRASSIKSAWSGVFTKEHHRQESRRLPFLAEAFQRIPAPPVSGVERDHGLLLGMDGDDDFVMGQRAGEVRFDQPHDDRVAQADLVLEIFPLA